MRHRLAEPLPRSRASFEASWRAGDDRRSSAALASEKVLKQRLVERLQRAIRGEPSKERFAGEGFRWVDER